MTDGLTVYESNVLREAANILRRKPEAGIKYLGGGNAGTDAILALSLSALLEAAKQHNEMQKVALAVAQFLVEA